MGPLGRDALANLTHANQLMAGGKALEAAAIFAGIVGLANSLNMPGRSAQLSMRTAFAYLQGGDVERALESARSGISGALALGDLGRATHAAQRFLAALNDKGLSAEAASFRAEVDQMLAGSGVALSQAAVASPPERLQLPAQCPSCLGPVRPDEVEWLDDRSAECAFCGNVLQAA